MNQQKLSPWALCGIAAVFASAERVAGQDPPPPAGSPVLQSLEKQLNLTRAELMDRVVWHVPDPKTDRERASEELKKAGEKLADAYRLRLIELLGALTRPTVIRLTLEDAVRRALESSYSIEIERYNPAIENTRVVEAEAAFDTVLFSNLTKNHVDQPSASQLAATQFDQFTWNSGVRKTLPTGMVVSGSYEFARVNTNLSFQGLNPEYTSGFVFEMRQPFLRGFGIDYNRSLIVIAQNTRDGSEFQFETRVRDTLREVEFNYWRLVQARRDVVVSARLLVDFEQILAFLDARKDFDVIPVQLAATQADLEQAKTDYIRAVADVFDAQDRLVAILNSDDINLADEFEIVPDDFPDLDRVLVDRLAEVQTALANRTEIMQRKKELESARIVIGRTKNEELPVLDFTFRHTIPGLGESASDSFHDSLDRDFTEYLFGLQFETPVGNRGPRAAHHRARLQFAAAAAALKAQYEQVILDVNVAIRRLNTAYDQIAPSLESASAREREVESIVVRAERKDLNTLINELSARQQLAASRRTMVAAMVEYNFAMMDLERAKGTLLQYNNIVIRDETGKDR